jgi:hypothetical protein
MCSNACNEAEIIRRCVVDQRPKKFPEDLDTLMREMVPPGPGGKGDAKKAARRDGGEGGPRRAGAGGDGSDDEDDSEDEDEDNEMLSGDEDGSSEVSEQVSGR